MFRGSERTSLALSLDKYGAERFLQEPGIESGLLTELLFPVKKPF